MPRWTFDACAGHLRLGFSRLLCTLAALSLAACAVSRDAEPSRKETREPLRIGTSFDYHPFSRASKAGNATPQGEPFGFDIAVGRAFAASRADSSGEARFEPDWVRFTWPELQRDFDAGKFDIAMSGVTVRTERSLAGRFSLPVAVSGAVAIVREGSATRTADLDRAGVVIAVNAGGHLERVTRRRFPAATIVAVPDNSRVMPELLERRALAAITDTHEVASWLRENPGLTTIGPFTRDYKAYWVQPDRVDLARELDAWLLARERDGTLGRLRLRYFGRRRGTEAWEPTALPAAALQAAVTERRALMPLVAEAKRESSRAIEDLEREAVVIAAGMESVRRAATARGVAPPDAASVRAFFANEIEEAKRIQRETLAKPRPASTRVYDLRADLRPALLRIGDKIAMLLVEQSLAGGAATTEPASRCSDPSSAGEGARSQPCE